jgi:hypothetical protein
MSSIAMMRSAAIVAAFGVAWSSDASAAVVGGEVTNIGRLGVTGEFVLLGVPFTASEPDNTVGSDTFQTFNLYAFNEEQNISVPSEIKVDVGTNPQAGDTVASHYVFFDPGPVTSIEGYVDFDADIFGVATSRGTLSASDFLANTGVTYLNPGSRGFERRDDSATIDPSNPRRLLLDLFAASPGDYARVFTMESPLSGGGMTPPTPPSTPETPAPIPLPAAGWLLLAAVGGLGALRRARGA